MMIFWIPLIVAVLGAVIYIVASHAKAVELARIAFFCGLLVFVWALAGSNVVVDAVRR